MRIKLHHSYKKPSQVKGQPSTTVFVYTVTGTEPELEKYEEIQGENFRKDDESGLPLFFTTRCAPNNAELLITNNDRIVVDMSAFDQAASLAAQYGGHLGTELARAAASQLMSFNTPVTKGAPQGEPEAEKKELGEK